MAKKASEGSGIVWCHDSGNRCIASAKEMTAEQIFLFARLDQNAPGFDNALDELSDGINRAVNDTQRIGRRKRDRDDIQIGFLRTGSGFLPVWKREVVGTERLEELVNIDSLTDLDALSDEELSSHLHINEARGDWRTHTESGGVYRCKGAGKSCYVTADLALELDAVGESSSRPGGYFPTVGEGSPIFDPTLHKLAGTLNSLIDDAEAREKQKRARDPKHSIGIAVTEGGLLLVWKVVEAHTEAGA